MVVDEDIYLEHYGKKGMKCGVRKERETRHLKKSNRDRNLKLAGASVAVGAAFISAWLAKNGNNKPYDYGHSLPIGDIGPSGLSGWKLPTN